MIRRIASDVESRPRPILGTGDPAPFGLGIAASRHAHVQTRSVEGTQTAINVCQFVLDTETRGAIGHHAFCRGGTRVPSIEARISAGAMTGRPVSTPSETEPPLLTNYRRTRTGEP